MATTFTSSSYAHLYSVIGDTVARNAESFFWLFIVFIVIFIFLFTLAYTLGTSHRDKKKRDSYNNHL